MKVYQFFKFLGSTRKTRIIDTAYCASGNELVRTKTLVKGMVIVVDAVPFRTWYENHYALPLAKKKVRFCSNERSLNLTILFYQE